MRGEGQPRGTPPHLATQCEFAATVYNFLPRVEQGLGQFYTRYSMYSTHVQCTVLAGRIDSQDDTAMSAWWATILKRQCHEIVLHFLFYESNSL